MKRVRTAGVGGAAAFLAVAAALALTGCITMGPDYERPELPVPEAYSEVSIPAAEAGMDEWWKLYGDPRLDALVDEALAANQSLAAAVARVDEARAFAGLARADQLPQIVAGASGARDKFSGATAAFPPGFSLERDTYRASVNLAYELDFWGRYRRLSEAARAELLATEEGRRNVRLAVIAETVDSWFDILSTREQLAISHATVGSRGESVRLQRLRFDAGSISEFDLARAEAELAGSEATVPIGERVLRQTEDRLGVILGRMGGFDSSEAFAAPSDPAVLDAVRAPDVPVGLPSELLTRRPDVVAAEQRLVAANARIGAARAAFFPSIALTGYSGSESDELSGLFKSGSGVWGFAAGLLQPIFQGGRLRRDFEIAEARERQALADYTGTVQSAFAEVEDALVARSTGATERAALGRRVEALSRASRLARLRYEAGDASYIEALDAERDLFIVQLAFVSARRGELGASVTLFKALGGGWEESPAAGEDATASAASPEAAP